MHMRGGIGLVVGNHVLLIVSTASSVLRVANRGLGVRTTLTRPPRVVMSHTVAIPIAVRDEFENETGVRERLASLGFYDGARCTHPFRN
jgi:hypothetical protein